MSDQQGQQLPQALQPFVRRQAQRTPQQQTKRRNDIAAQHRRMNQDVGIHHFVHLVTLPSLTAIRQYLQANHLDARHPQMRLRARTAQENRNLSLRDRIELILPEYTRMQSLGTAAPQVLQQNPLLDNTMRRIHHLYGTLDAAAVRYLSQRLPEQFTQERFRQILADTGLFPATATATAQGGAAAPQQKQQRQTQPR